MKSHVCDILYILLIHQQQEQQQENKSISVYCITLSSEYVISTLSRSARLCQSLLCSVVSQKLSSTRGFRSPSLKPPNAAHEYNIEISKVRLKPETNTNNQQTRQSWAHMLRLHKRASYDIAWSYSLHHPKLSHGDFAQSMCVVFMRLTCK